MTDAVDITTARANGALDVLALACEVDHGALDFDDPRRSYEALEEIAQRYLDDQPLGDEGWAVGTLAGIAANMFRRLVGLDELDRIKATLEDERRRWNRQH